MGIKQAQIAQITGRSVQQISQIERGQREPKLSTLILLAYSLGMEPDELVRRTVSAMPDPITLINTPDEEEQE